ncbi:lactate dehydrogenase [Desulfonema ishimotonii]|uniref:Lactate dehydrogenase n=1 Tax=Desulfonema ishimotonii TaxID=45657 RepID=A0A401FSQ6_9BACT|nr:2-hydroxyacid dehydrogenase [Desulfonema ishimotonii]GBC59997.1 lactate dehydrogenase [Desulfonema ishimotonii]
MKILFAAPENAWGGFLDSVRAELPEHQFVATGRFEADTLSGYDVLIPTMSFISRELLRTADRLRLIQQCGAGIERVDQAAAREMGIPVANVPSDISGNADSVAEVGIYLMIGLARNFRGMARSLAEGSIGGPMGAALSGKTVGLVGLGGIAKALIRRLRAFDMRMIGIKRHEPARAGDELGLDWCGGPERLDDLLGESDFVVLCLPQTDDNLNMMNPGRFRRMKSDAFLINLSRGGLVERDALEAALATGEIAGAGLDVFWEEPPDPDDPVFRYNVLTTPHIGGATDISARGIRDVVVENIRRAGQNRELLYVRNR